MAAGVVEHGAPAGHWGEDAYAEETQRGFGEDGAGHGDGGLDQHRLQDIRGKMTQQNACVRSTERAGGEDVFHFFGLQNLCAGEACIACPSGDHESENYFAEARAEECCERNGEQDSGEGEKRVDEDDVDEAVEPAAEVACYRT